MERFTYRLFGITFGILVGIVLLRNIELLDSLRKALIITLGGNV